MDLINSRNFEDEVFKLQDKLNNKAFFCSVALFHAVDGLLKKSRETKEPTPYDVIYKYSANTYGLNYDYAKSVANQLKKEGKGDEYEALKPYGKTHVSRMILQKDTDENQYYLQLACNSANKGDTRYFDADGNELAFDDIKQYLPTSEFTHYKTKRQGTDKEIMVITPKLQTIVKLSLGDFAYDDTDKLPVTV